MPYLIMSACSPARLCVLAGSGLLDRCCRLCRGTHSQCACIRCQSQRWQSGPSACAMMGLCCRRVGLRPHTPSSAAVFCAPLPHMLRFHHALPPDRTHCACLRCEQRGCKQKRPITGARPFSHAPASGADHNNSSASITTKWGHLRTLDFPAEITKLFKLLLRPMVPQSHSLVTACCLASRIGVRVEAPRIGFSRASFFSSLTGLTDAAKGH